MERGPMGYLILLLACMMFTAYGCKPRAVAAPNISGNSKCVSCHQDRNPALVADHLAGKMARAGIDCSVCHGTDHMDEKTAGKAQIPNLKTCEKCHPEKVKQFLSGKHAFGWIAMNALPVTPLQPHAAIDGLKGCGGCHKIGIQDQASDSKSRYGMGCNSCHTRHKFSKAEAQRPQSCNPCHQGLNYVQWDAWSHSKHGVIYSVEGDTGRAPTCQTCHMQEGDHSVMTGWGELALLTEGNDPEWAKYRSTIFKYLHALDPKGNPTPGLEGILSIKMLRGSLKEWTGQREKMIQTCTRCHSRSYAKMHLENADQLIKETDKLSAQAIETVADLYRRGILRPDKGQLNYPNIGIMYESRTLIELTLQKMLIEDRTSVIHGAFHMDPWFVTDGQAALKKSLLEIQLLAREMSQEAGAH